MNATVDQDKKLTLIIRMVGVIVWLPYLLSILSPGSWWGVHFIAFIPAVWKFGLLLVSLGMVLFASQSARLIDSVVRLPLWDRNQVRKVLFVVIVAGFGIVYYNFPMHKSFYGDSEIFAQKMGVRTESYSDTYLENLLTLNVLSPKSGNKTVLSAVRLLSLITGTTHQQVYRIFDAFFGMLFIGIWLFFLCQYLKNVHLKILFSVLGFLAPFTQFFFGYEEIYAPAIPALFGYFMVLLKYFERGESKFLWWQALLLFICMKLHSSSLMLVPSLLVTVFYHHADRFKFNRKHLTWSSITKFVLVPIVAIGAVVYFFVLEDHKDLRFVTQEVDIYTRIFLPIFAPDPPLDKYTLLSPAHFFDYLNMVYLWSSGVVFLIAVLILFRRKGINWSSPVLVIIGSTFLLYLLLFFMINPLMSMPMDCDYFSLPAASLFMVALVMAKQLEDESLFRSIVAPVLGFSLLCMPIFITNHSRNALSQRMEKMGTYVFKTYWIRSAGDIADGIELESKKNNAYAERYQAVLKDLKPFANDGNDIEYANLLWRLAKYYRTEKKAYNTALDYHQQALSYDPNLVANYVGLMESNYFLNRYEQAYQYSIKLIDYGYPNRKQAIRIAIECAMLGGLFEQAIGHCDVYLSNWDDQDIATVRADLVKEIQANK